jgi:hypothetical protein
VAIARHSEQLDGKTGFCPRKPGRKRVVDDDRAISGLRDDARSDRLIDHEFYAFVSGRRWPEDRNEGRRALHPRPRALEK